MYKIQRFQLDLKIQSKNIMLVITSLLHYVFMPEFLEYLISINLHNEILNS